MKKIMSLFFAISLIVSCNQNTVDLKMAETEATSFLESQFDFFSSGNIDDAKKKFDTDAVLIGTDEAEFLSGWGEVEPSLIGQFAAVKSPKFNYRDMNIVMSDDGKMASYTQRVDFKFKSGEEIIEIKNVRASGVIKKFGDSWKIMQIHWSMGVQGQVVEY